MKKHIQNIITILPILTLIWITGCDDKIDGFESGGRYVVGSQEDIASFNASGEIYSLIVSGTGVTDISSLNVSKVKNITISETGIETLNLPSLSAITQSMIISDNPKLRSISGLPNLKFLNGNVSINNNDSLSDISGFLNLKTFIGTLNIVDNVSLGEDIPDAGDYTYGLFPVKFLKENNIIDGTITLSNNHPGAATDVALIGNMGGDNILDYTISSSADAEAFAPSNDTVNNLKISGSGITNDLLIGMASKFKVVRGTVTLENTSVTTSEGFFDIIKCLGGIVLKDNLSGGGLFNLNGFKAYTEIGGDLIVENCPGAAHWGSGTCFSQVTNIKGNVRMTGGQMANNAFSSLTTVEGDFEIRNNNEIDFWNLSEGILESIGGDLIYAENSKVNGLAGFEKIKSIGGNVNIERNGSTDPSIGEIPDYSVPGRPGWCLVKSWIEDGIVQSTANVTLSLSTGDVIDIQNITSCGGEKTSYTINGLAELKQFTDAADPDNKEIVQNLIITGGDITDNDISFVQTRVSEVRGTVTWDGLDLVTTTENFFEKFTCKGGIIIKNMPALNNVNAFKGYTEIGGDLIFENCPNIPTAAWGVGNCLSMITRVEGNLEFSGIQTDISGVTFSSLVEVGGDFEATDNNGNFWNFAGMNIKSIGGDLILRDNEKFNGLGGFQALESIGGDVIIFDNGSDLPENSTSNQVGLCLIKHFKDSGIVSAAAVISLGTTSSPVDVNTLTPCE